MLTSPVPCRHNRNPAPSGPQHLKVRLRQRLCPDPPGVSATESLPCPAQQPGFERAVEDDDVSRTDRQAVPPSGNRPVSCAVPFLARWMRSFAITSGSSMQAMIRTAPPQTGQVSMSMWNTRVRRCAKAHGSPALRPHGDAIRDRVAEQLIQPPPFTASPASCSRRHVSAIPAVPGNDRRALRWCGPAG